MHPNLKEQIPEDDVFRWEAYIDHLQELGRIDEELHKDYLANLDNEGRPPVESDAIYLAA